MTASDGPAGTDVDAVVIGAGFSGLYMLHKLRNQMGLTARVFETGAVSGGPGTGTATLERAAILTATSTASPSTRISGVSGNGVSATRSSTRSAPTWST